MKTNILLMAALLLAVTACKKKDKEAPSIAILSPNSNVMYMNGDTMHIHVEVNDNEVLGEVHVELHNESLGSEEIHVHDEGGDPSYVFMQDYVININDHTDFMLRVNAMDEAGNAAKDSFHVHVHP